MSPTLASWKFQFTPGELKSHPEARRAFSLRRIDSNFFLATVSRFRLCHLCRKCELGFKLPPTEQKFREKVQFKLYGIRYFTWIPTWSFYVEVSQRTTVKCAKNQNAGAGRVKRVESAELCSNFCLCSLNMHISDVLVAISVVTAQNRPWGV